MRQAAALLVGWYLHFVDFAGPFVERPFTFLVGEGRLGWLRYDAALSEECASTVRRALEAPTLARPGGCPQF